MSAQFRKPGKSYISPIFNHVQIESDPICGRVRSSTGIGAAAATATATGADRWCGNVMKIV